MKDAHERESGEGQLSSRAACETGSRTPRGGSSTWANPLVRSEGWAHEGEGAFTVDLTHERTETAFWIDGGSHANGEVISNGNCG